MHVLVYDPKNPVAEGDVVDVFRNDSTAVQEREGRVYLPALDRVAHGSISPWSRRSFGSKGILLTATPRYYGHAALVVRKEASHVHWAALIERLDSGRPDPVEVMVRLAGDPHDPPLSPAPIQNEDANLARIVSAEHDWWVVKGRAQCRVTQEQIAGFALYGQARGDVALKWLAVSQTKE
jgi:hypothetical protein